MHMFKKSLLLTTLIGFLLISGVSVVHSQSSEPTEASSETDDEAVEKNIKDRLQKVIEEKSDQIKGVMEGNQRRGFIGIMQRVSEEALTMETPRGPVVLTVTPDIEFWDDDDPIDLEDIEIGESLVIIGTQNGDEFTAERIYISTTPFEPILREIIVGNIQEIDQNSLTIQARSGDENTYAFNKDTVFTNSEGEEVRSDDFVTDQDALLIVRPEDQKNQTAQSSSGRITLIRALGELNN